MANSLERDAIALAGACSSPGEAYWRVLELEAVRQVGELPRPILEIGCGNGMFTELLGVRIDLAIDVEPNAVERASRRMDVYAEVQQLDVHALDESAGQFQTVFSNSVLEHIAELDGVLERCRWVLLGGGRLIATVPLVEMNDHLAVRGRRYALRRQRQLVHRNLWTLAEWEAHLRGAGFASVSAIPYLDAAACRRWDRLDAVGSIGLGRLRLASVVHRGLQATLPRAADRWLHKWIGKGLMRWAAGAPEGPACAAVIVAVAE